MSEGGFQKVEILKCTGSDEMHMARDRVVSGQQTTIGQTDRKKSRSLALFSYSHDTVARRIRKAETQCEQHGCERKYKGWARLVMKKIEKCFLFSAAACVLLPAECAVAQQDTQGFREAQLSTLQSILAKRDFGQRVASPQAAAGFCDALFSDLTAGKRVKVIAPIVETDDPMNPQLAKYEACSIHDFLADDEKRGGPSPYAFQGLTGAVQGDAGITIATVGDKNFKLFSIKPDRSSNSAQEILYGEWSRERRMRGERHGGYWLIDTKQCLIKGAAPAAEEPLEKTVRSDYVERMNLLLKYGNDYFVLNLTDVMVYNRQRPEQEPLYGITLYKYDIAHNDKFQLFCAAKEPLPKWAQ